MLQVQAVTFVVVFFTENKYFVTGFGHGRACLVMVTGALSGPYPSVRVRPGHA
jgi:hypothetical protein